MRERERECERENVYVAEQFENTWQIYMARQNISSKNKDILLQNPYY